MRKSLTMDIKKKVGIQQMKRKRKKKQRNEKIDQKRESTAVNQEMKITYPKEENRYY